MVGPSLSESGRPYLRFEGAGDKVWLLPTQLMLRQTAVKMYAPYSLKGRVFKALMRIGAVGNRVHIDDAELSDLEQTLAQALGEPAVRLAFYNPVLPDRRILLIMKPEGGIIAYAHMAGSDSARQVLEHEEQILNTLREAPALAPHVPETIAFLNHNSASVLIISAGPGQKGPTEWTAHHSDFSRKLHATFKKDLPLGKSALWRHSMTVLENNKPHLSELWRKRYDAALVRLEPYKDTVIPMSMAHRDFTPWNTQVGREHIFVFDWEYARDGYTPNYDYFFFHFVISSNVNRNVSVEGARSWLPGAPIKAPVSNEVLFLAYLLDIATFYHRGLEAPDFEETDILRESGTLLDGIDEWFKN